MGNNLPDFVVRHPDALTVGSVGGHNRAGDSQADILEHIGVGVAVTFVGAGEIGTAASAACAEAVTEGAVNAEFELARLCSFWILGKRIVGFVG